MSRARVHDGSVTVDVECYTTAEVDIEDVLRKIGDKYLVQECRRRGIPTIGEAASAPNDDALARWRDLADEIRRAAFAGDRLHLGVLLVRMLAMGGVRKERIPAKPDRQLSTEQRHG